MVDIDIELEGIEELQEQLDYLQSHAVKVGVLGNGSAKRRMETKAKRKLLKRQGKLKKGGSFVNKDKNRKKSKLALVEEYAVFNEYGTSRIPARPFFRLSIATSKAQKEIESFMENEINKVVNGEISGEDYYNNLGAYIVKRIKNTIATYNFAPNNPKTLKIKSKNNQGNKPLMATHTLYNSISYEIVGA